jgi:hypothetical protein
MAYTTTGLISLAEVKALTGLTSANDSIINSLIPSVAEQIETYLDRRLCKYTWFEWKKYDNNLELSQYPINNVLMMGTPTQVITITDTSDAYNFNITQEDNTNYTIKSKLSVINQSTFAVTDYSFDTYITLTDLKTAVETAIPAITITIEAGYETQNTKCLRSGTGKSVYGVVKQDILYRIDDNSNRYLSIPNNIYLNFNVVDCWFDNVLFVAYSAGYDSTDVPAGLKLIVANIIKDCVNINSLGSSSLLKSESIKNYSYSLFDSSQISVLINQKYAVDLYQYSKKSI